MNETDRQYQDAVDDVARNLAAGDKGNLRDRELLTDGNFDTAIGPLRCGINHQNPDETHPFHSIVVTASRPLWLVLQRKYSAGFSFDDDGELLPIPDDILCSWD